MKKKSPQSLPATQADVRRARSKGIDDGVTMACVIILTVLVDKFGGSPYIPELWREINKLSEEVKEGRVSLSDLRNVLRTEYQIEI